MIPKFRAWDRLSNSMRDVLCVDWLNELIDLSSGIIERAFYDVVLMQSTGIEDKSGIEIFDGDFLTDGEVRWIVKYSETECGFSAMGIGNTGCWSLYHLANGGRKGRLIKVIGNIHENPELLKVS